MGLPKLKMTKPDIETAISREFRKQFKSLEYKPKLEVLDIDGNVLVSLNREFDGIGIYPFSIICRLYIPMPGVNAAMTQRYTLQGTVNIGNTSENEPIVTFDSSIFAKKIP